MNVCDYKNCGNFAFYAKFLEMPTRCHLHGNVDKKLNAHRKDCVDIYVKYKDIGFSIDQVKNDARLSYLVKACEDVYFFLAPDCEICKEKGYTFEAFYGYDYPQVCAIHKKENMRCFLYGNTKCSCFSCKNYRREKKRVLKLLR